MPEAGERAVDLPDASSAVRGRQTLMFSATWPKEVRELAGEFQHSPVRIHVGDNDKLVANSDVTQHVRVTESRAEKLAALEDLVREQEEFARGRAGRQTRRADGVAA